MGSVYKRGRTWWLKYKDAAGAWKPEATKAATKTEAKALLHEIERRVERQRLGLEPLSLNPEGWTVGELMHWWLDTYSRHSPSHEKNLGTVRRQILGTPLAEKPLQHVQPGDVEQLLQAMEGDYSASTINHVRQFLVGAFNRAASGWARTRPSRSARGAAPSRSATSCGRRNSRRSWRRWSRISARCSRPRSSPASARASCAGCRRRTSISGGGSS